MELKLRIYQDLSTLSHAAAETVCAELAQAVQARGTASIALSGGSTPAALYQLLATAPYAAQIPWAYVHFFWGDERCVPPNTEGSSFKQAQELLLSHVPVPPENIHRVRGELPPTEAAAEYAQVLAHNAARGLPWPCLDVVLLGLGEDGHTASLFPGPIIEAEKTQPTLAVTANYQNRPANRVTLTPRVFNDARQVLFLVAGVGKAEAVRAVLKGYANPIQWPASRIRPTLGTVTWMLDEAAASLINR